MDLKMVNGSDDNDFQMEKSDDGDESVIDDANSCTPSTSASEDADESNESDEHEYTQTEEFAESELQQQFRTALLAAADDHREEAVILFDQLTKSPLLQCFEQVDTPSFDWSSDPPAHLSLPARLFCAIHRNLAEIHIASGRPSLAIASLFQALTLDRSTTLWHELAMQCVAINELTMAEFALGQALISDPKCVDFLDNSACVLFLASDYTSCICRIKSILDLDCNHKRSLVLKESIFERCPFLLNRCRSWFPDPEFEITPIITENDRKEVFAKLDPLFDQRQSMDIETNKRTAPKVFPITVKLKSIDWSSLGESLCQVYNEMDSCDWFPTQSVDLSEWLITIENEKSARKLDRVSDLPSKKSLPRVSLPVEPPSCKSCENTDDKIIAELLDDLLVHATSLVQSSALSIKESMLRMRLSRKNRRLMSTSQPETDLSAVFKRRSSRFVPGFSVDDDFLNAAKPVPLDIQLKNCLPATLLSQSNDPIRTVPESIEDACAHDANCFWEETCDDEKRQVAELVGRHVEEDRSLLDLLEDYLCTLQTRVFDGIWSDRLRSVFVDCYQRWRPHILFTSPSDPDCPISSVIRRGFVHLTVAEFLANHRHPSSTLQKSTGHAMFLASFTDHFDFLFAIRAHWLSFHLSSGNVDIQMTHLAIIESLLRQNQLGHLSVPNAIGGCVSTSKIAHYIRQLEKAIQLESVERLFKEGQLEHVVDLLAGSWTDGWASADLSERLKNCFILMTSLQELHRSNECLLWASRTMSDLVNSHSNTGSFDRMDELLTILEKLLGTCRGADVAIGELGSLVHNLIRVICMRMDSPSQSSLSFVSPWIVLFLVVDLVESSTLTCQNLNERFRSLGNNRVLLSSASLMILRMAHCELGRRGKCLAEDGRVLLFYVEHLRRHLQLPQVHELIGAKDAKFRGVKDYMLNEAEQCFYCLYKYSLKRKHHLIEHGSQGLELTWARGSAVFDFVSPDKNDVPIFDDVITNLISSDAVQFMERLIRLASAEHRPDELLGQFGRFVSSPANLSSPWPCLPPDNSSDRSIVAEMYYLMADYWFKTADITNAIQLYEKHLAVVGASDSPHLFSSWGGLALSRAALLATQLQNCDNFSLVYADERRLSFQTVFAFESALKINESHRILHTEYADILYQLRAKLLRGAKSLELDDDRHGEIDQRCSELLHGTCKHFGRALELLSGTGEAWLCHYFLGKLGEKSGAEPREVLSHYHDSAVLLMLEGARYPNRITYKPRQFELEALEIHYRVHAAVIKWLARPCRWSVQQMNIMLHYLKLFLHHGVCRRPVDQSLKWHRTVDVIPEWTRHLHGNEISTLLDDILDRVILRDHLLSLCMDAMRLCIRRFQNHHYKAYYRLAQCYLLGHSQQNLWRIPVDEIDRSGSFFFHMARCCSLTVRVAFAVSDLTSLLDVLVALCRKPTDKKLQYVSEYNRKLLCRKASRYGLVVVHDLLDESDEQLRRNILILYRTVQILKKASVPSASHWNRVLRCFFLRLFPFTNDSNAHELDMHIVEMCVLWEQKRTEIKLARSLNIRFNLAEKKQRKRRMPHLVTDLEKRQFRPESPIGTIESPPIKIKNVDHQKRQTGFDTSAPLISPPTEGSNNRPILII